jgi:hypothetical protein
VGSGLLLGQAEGLCGKEKEKGKKSKVARLRIRAKPILEIEIPLDFQILLQIHIPV